MCVVTGNRPVFTKIKTAVILVETLDRITLSSFQAHPALRLDFIDRRYDVFIQVLKTNLLQTQVTELRYNNFQRGNCLVERLITLLT